MKNLIFIGFFLLSFNIYSQELELPDLEKIVHLDYEEAHAFIKKQGLTIVEEKNSKKGSRERIYRTKKSSDFWCELVERKYDSTSTSLEILFHFSDENLYNYFKVHLNAIYQIDREYSQRGSDNMNYQGYNTFSGGENETGDFLSAVLFEKYDNHFAIEIVLYNFE